MADFINLQVGGITITMYLLIGITTGILAYTTLASEQEAQTSEQPPQKQQQPPSQEQPPNERKEEPTQEGGKKRSKMRKTKSSKDNPHSRSKKIRNKL